jgi:hypothetical protein
LSTTRQTQPRQTQPRQTQPRQTQPRPGPHRQAVPVAPSDKNQLEVGFGIDSDQVQGTASPGYIHFRAWPKGSGYTHLTLEGLRKRCRQRRGDPPNQTDYRIPANPLSPWCGARSLVSSSKPSALASRSEAIALTRSARCRWRTSMPPRTSGRCLSSRLST